jgi:hypothetical protein
MPRTSLIARMQKLGLAKQPTAQNGRPSAPHGVESWAPADAKPHLVKIARAGYGGFDREYAYVR